MTVIFLVDLDVVRYAQVCKGWRQFIDRAGGIRTHLMRIQKSELAEKSLEVLKKTFDEIDDIFLYCYMKHLDSGVVYGWGSNHRGQLENDALNRTHLPPREITMLGSVTGIFAGSNASFVTTFSISGKYGDRRKN